MANLKTNDFYTTADALSANISGIGFGTITAANTSLQLQPTTIEAHGVKYKTQKFEDRPTLFGSPLRMQWNVSDMSLLTVPDADAFAAELMRKNVRELKMTIAATCPDCVECPKCDIKVQKEQDDLRQATRFLLQASCKSERNTAHMMFCPNGKAAVIKGSTALVPDLAMMPRPEFTDIPNTMVSTPKPQPYMRPISPDTPMTAADEAW
jgi:hypothetical protein